MLFPREQRRNEPCKVVITGAGIITGLGSGWAVNADGFRQGRSAFSPVTLFNVSRHRVKHAAQVDLTVLPSEFQGVAHRSDRLDRAGAMLMLAAAECWQQAGWDAGAEIPMVLGTTAGGMAFGESYFRQATQTPESRCRQPTRAIHYQAHTQARLVADVLGFHGPIFLVSNACASGANAVGQAWELVRSGAAPRVLTGGYDGLSELVYTGFDSLQALSPGACRPFDKDRDGLALGEGAGMLALESLESARNRGAAILGEVLGYASTIDTHHLTQPHPEGHAAYESMRRACEAGGVRPEDVDYVNAHGTGTPLNDAAEALAIRRWAGSRASSLPVSSTKASVGHLLGGAGAVEAVVCVMALQGQWLPPEATFNSPDPACNFLIVSKPQDALVDVVISNSFGFGGINASLLLRRWS